MEILLAACLLAWAAGAQSEQAKLGISPAQRSLIREQVRHEKAVRRIAEKHGIPASSDGSPDDPKSEPSPVTLPEAFRAGYRGYAPVARVATPAGRLAGDWAARGVHWAKDTGRSALLEYRKRRKAAGEPDPAPVHGPQVPPMPAYPPMPTTPPTVGSADPANVTPERPEGAPESKDAEDPAPIESGTATTAPAPEPTVPEPRSEHVPEPAESANPNAPATTEGGTGRMATEVTYDSVMDESDELSLMCEDDRSVYRRIRERCEREIGRADSLIAQLKSPGVQAWISRCAEQYRVILAQLDELDANTIAQGEGVVKAKALLLAGQGLYAGIAADMEEVEEREFYISDAVDSEDTNAAAETYETQGA
ncbi:hypothetical protein [Streptomyces sp. WM6372]|uniref:hypothetical protein n=1 Tax=Streptomyces sp. WM6372 TaxID=1415555 RepID=UPI0006AE5F31|nr:hypothetical protein [Streptomyces sp. WM6372]